ncbi:MlaE family ABC transporter permease [Paenalcaligenes suwonensis]|uniref:MlaE family ABC transporter permease n=1 Tax=Paenalcaligenes suwonensis TaxID=1202713 RepID=UPI00140A20B9|nr:ABC transporter permease [Paenalcaligenes suwonensis]NHC60362.1 ABC transporter permease [Paenalcaligenes suwonensis]
MGLTQNAVIVTEASGQTTTVRLQGQWEAGVLSDEKHSKRLLPQLRQAAGSTQTVWDLSDAHGLDYVTAQILWDCWGRQWPEQLHVTDIQQGILERVAELTVEPVHEEECTVTQRAFVSLGNMAFNGWNHAKGMIALLGQFLLDVLKLIRRPSRGPWHDFSAHLFRMGAQALPITALVGFLIGVVVAYLLALQLRQFGADAFIVNILGISLIRELGPLLAAILVAGRSGSAITAQIGVMRVNEELDAMQVMGISHGYRLVMPRVLALAVAMPLVSVWTTLAALLGGMWASEASLGLSPAYFVQALPNAVQVANVWLATAKSAVFGAAIALIGCYWGLWVKPNTESLGSGTTASVVTSITAVILLDAVFAILFKSVGF